MMARYLFKFYDKYTNYSDCDWFLAETETDAWDQASDYADRRDFTDMKIILVKEV